MNGLKRYLGGKLIRIHAELHIELKVREESKMLETFLACIE